MMLFELFGNSPVVGGRTHLWYWIIFVVLGVGGSAACDPDDPIIALLTYDEASDAYVMADVAVTTLSDVERMKGDATALIGGADVTLDYEESTMTWHDPGHSVAFSAINEDGVLVPEDYDSLAMASIYYNIESSMLFFESLGFDSSKVDIPTYYNPKFTIIKPDGSSDADEEVAEDNAFYMYMTKKDQALFILPFDQFQWVPLPLNTGIITHEYSHAAFDILIPKPDRPGDMSNAAENFLYGVNEGFADFMAVARTRDANFMEHTAEEGVFITECNENTQIELVRDASIPIDYTETRHDAPARNTDHAEFCPYDVGSFLSSLMYEIAGELDQPSNRAEALDQTAEWLVKAMGDLGKVLSADFELWQLISLFIERVDSDANRVKACSVVEKRYSLYYSNVEGC